MNGPKLPDSNPNKWLVAIFGNFATTLIGLIGAVVLIGYAVLTWVNQDPVDDANITELVTAISILLLGGAAKNGWTSSKSLGIDK